MGFFLPLAGLFYGIVPREQRVLAFSAASLVYTTILSLWKGARDRHLEVARSAAVLCCSVLQCVAVCRSVLQCVAVCCSLPTGTGVEVRLRPTMTRP